MGAENGEGVEPHEVAEVLARALVSAYGARAEAIQLAVEPRLWVLRASHRARLLSSHCVFCGRSDEKLLLKALCARCVVVCRALAKRRVRGTRGPEGEMAVALASRALRAASADHAAEVVESVASSRVPSTETICSRCGPFRGWPREAAEDEECFACKRTLPAVPALIAGPFRSMCVFCLERAHREVPAARRKIVPKTRSK